MDVESGGERQRFLMVADYLRALRILGAVSPVVQDRWRQVCNTAELSPLKRVVGFLLLHVAEQSRKFLE